MGTKTKYEITGITHSGRIGLRDTPVNNPKYDGVVGSIVTLVNADKLEDYFQFQELKFHFVKTESGYDWWNTSCVICIGLDINNIYVVETINSIYYLRKLEGEKQ